MHKNHPHVEDKKCLPLLFFLGILLSLQQSCKTCEKLHVRLRSINNGIKCTIHLVITCLATLIFLFLWYHSDLEKYLVPSKLQANDVSMMTKLLPDANVMFLL
jgi:hypothetical protein